MDLNVRHRLARIRRNFLTLGWKTASAETNSQSRVNPTPYEPDRDLILEDTLAGYDGIRVANGVEWRPENPRAFDDQETAWNPSPKTRAAVFGLAENIREEGEALVDLAACARKAVEQLLQEHAEATARITVDASRRTIKEPGSTSKTLQSLPEGQVNFDGMHKLVREIGTISLNAALSAIRAGASTRGFSRVARGVDELERALRGAWDEIEIVIVDLEDRAAHTAATSAKLRSNGNAFAQSTAAIAWNAPIDRARATAMSAQLDQLKLLTNKIARTGIAIAVACDEMANLVHTLAEQLVVVVRETPVGNRRSAKRVAFEASCIISTSERSYPGKSLDLSATGALIKVRQEVTLQRGQPITLHLQAVAPIVGTVANVSAQGVHIAFDLGHSANAAAKPALMKMLDALLARSHDLIDRSTRFAREIREALEHGVAEDLVSTEELLSTQYDPIMGTHPQQFRHPALPFYEETLTPILEAFQRNTPNAAYVVAMDRGGYVPVQKRAPANGQTTTNIRTQSRRRRVYADWLSQRAARNLRPFLIQIVPLETAKVDGENVEHAETVRSVSVPIFVRGRHWGCAEIGYQLEDGDAAFSSMGV